MDGISEGYNAGWGLLGTDVGKALADSWQEENDPQYAERKKMQEYIDQQIAASTPQRSPAQPMASPDFSNAPAWWNKGNDQQSPIQPQTPMLPAAPAASTPIKSPLMYDVLGNVGGRTGITGQQALSTALRAGGESNGQ